MGAGRGPGRGAQLRGGAPRDPAGLPGDKVCPTRCMLADLDTQHGAPSEHEALRVAGNLVTADGQCWRRRSWSGRVGIGSRVRMVYVGRGRLFAAHWTLDEDAAQLETPWRYPQE